MTEKKEDIIAELNSLDVNRIKSAIKKIISAMTIGRDLSKVFPQVVKAIATNDIELKKLVYLYIINYARVKPLESLLAVNYFKKDSSDHNPLLRGLAVRTMGCLGVEQIMQFLCDPLKDCLRDKDPYVRKTAVLCVAKIFDVHPQLVEEQFGFIEILQNLIETEGNSMVLANCVAALNEISISKNKEMLILNWKKCRCLLTALHDNNEWSQIYLLEGISKFLPENQDQINELIERILPSLNHSNSGIVLTTIKILIKLLELVDNTETVRTICKKITPSLESLLSEKPEIAYIALKNINILIQKRPLIFEKDFKMFYCLFSEPIYVKLEKLEILYKLVSMTNVDNIIGELKEYASEVDVQYVRRSVRLIGEIAIKLEKSAVRCVETLVDLVKTQVPYVVQEAIISLRDIFRRYPNTFESAMAIVNENLKALNDPESKAAFIWIIGEYAERIEGAESQLSKFMDTIKDEHNIVQMNLLTAAMKTFLKCQSEESFTLLNSLFQFASNECDSADIREKGYIYYRLINLSPELASQVVLSEKPRISEDSNNMNSSIVDKLLDNLGTLSTIYSKIPEQFVRKGNNLNTGEEEDLELEEERFEVEEKQNENMYVMHDEDDRKDDNSLQNVNQIVNLLDLDDIQTINSNITGINLNQKEEIKATNSFVPDDLFGTLTINSQSNNTYKIKDYSLNIPLTIVHNENNPGVKYNKTGLSIQSAFIKSNSNIYLKLKFTNFTNLIVNDFKIKFNKNNFGLTIDLNSLKSINLLQNSTEEVLVKVDIDTINIDHNYNEKPPIYIETAIISSLDEYYFTTPLLISILFEEGKDISKEEFLSYWKNIETTDNMYSTFDNLHIEYRSEETIKERLKASSINNIHSIINNDQVQLFFYSFCGKDINLISLNINQGQPDLVNLVVKTSSGLYISHIISAIRFILTTASS